MSLYAPLRTLKAVKSVTLKRTERATIRADSREVYRSFVRSLAKRSLGRTGLRNAECEGDRRMEVAQVVSNGEFRY
jgi:hypothetical protein